MRKYRAMKRNVCPVCTISLKPEFEYLHKGCPWYEKNHVHAKEEEWHEDYMIGI